VVAATAGTQKFSGRNLVTIFSILPFAAGILSLVMATISLVPGRRSFARWCYFAGLAILGVDSLCAGLVQRAALPTEVDLWLTLRLITESFLPAVWLGFSLTYSRADYRESLSRWRIPLMVVALLPIGLSLGFQQQLLDWAPAGPPAEELQLRLGAVAKALNAIILVALIWILTNLEQTFRSAVGTGRWKIKFVVLGLAVIFGARLYVRTQAVLFSSYDMSWSGVESSAILIGCAFLMLAYIRTGFAEIDLYPSRALLRSSLTVFFVGGYLFVVGILANIVRRFGGAESFQLAAFVLLLGIAGLGTVMLSDKLRQRIRGFVGLHFARSQHDSVRIWTEFSRRLANVKDQAGLCNVSATLVAGTFEVLSVSTWLLDEQKDQLFLGASTTPQRGAAIDGSPIAAVSSAVAAGLRAWSSPFDLESVSEPWAEELRRLNPATFPNGGNRWCVPLRAGEHTLGAMVLADRVNGARYTAEELQLLQCIADQVTSVLLNLRLAGEVARSRELGAFRTMSAFFVHDLKNAAASLNLMLKNLPVHFDDPAFRADALRGIGNTARRIDEMIGRLTTLRQRPTLKPIEADLNQLVSEALDGLDQMPQVELTRELQPLPRIMADGDQIRSVVTNLVLNARDALGPEGRIRLRTEHLNGNVVLSVTDNGCGMSAAFLRDSLFRPFQSTKKKGLGIGMFQSRMIVEAHGGSIRVESESGHGSTFRVSLPVKDVK
jgi:putative PEP-CTERM system histidine kinase